MSNIPIGLQLYSVREDCARDLPGVLAAVAGMGYVGVEFAGYYGRTADELRALLEANGLKCCGTHTKLDTILDGELERTIAFNQTLGNPFLIVPGLPAERKQSLTAWRETARLFRDAAERSAAQGMKVGYHNHSEEFQPLEDDNGEFALPFDVFFQSAGLDVVMQADTGNMMHGGADPVAFLRRSPGQALTVHLKEFSADNPNALVGDGEVPWNEVFGLCESVGGTQWYIVEQETYADPPPECVARCLQNLRGLGK